MEPTLATSMPTLTSFLLLTFADLKKYKYYYWFAFPGFVQKPAWEVLELLPQQIRDRKGLNDELDDGPWTRVDEAEVRRSFFFFFYQDC